jgi:hypothetical protein
MKPTHLRAYAFTPSICSTRQSDTSANIHKREHKFGFALMFFDISGACLCSCVCFYSSLLLLLELCYHSLYRLQETLNREDPCRETKGYKRTLWPQFWSMEHLRRVGRHPHPLGHHNGDVGSSKLNLGKQIIASCIHYFSVICFLLYIPKFLLHLHLWYCSNINSTFKRAIKCKNCSLILRGEAKGGE